MTEYIDNCDVYAASYVVALSNGHRVLKKVPLKARINAQTGEVQMFVDPDKLAVLKKQEASSA